MIKFIEKFRFDPNKTLYVGVERERFLCVNGRIAPIAPMVIEKLRRHGARFGYELSACQLEDRIGPCLIEQAHEALSQNDAWIAEAEGCPIKEFHSQFFEIAPEDMPLNIYPDPSGRYGNLVRTLPPNILLAACRVTGTHIHIGMPDHATALRTYNAVIPYCPMLCERGNGSFGERLESYRIMAPDCEPKRYKDWEDFARAAVEKGFFEDPRQCWTLIRISTHGTIEFRMFGATSSLSRIVAWTKLCHELCSKAMS